MFSRVIRRTHMYLALFLAPWMVGYALSTIFMNHRVPRPTPFVTERDEPYPNVFDPGTPPHEIARQILSDLDLAGASGVQGPAPDGRIIINRQGMLAPRRITVNCVDPGPNDTGYADDALRAAVAAANPGRRWGGPADTARLVAWLASDEAGWVTGQVIASDGGWSVR